MTNIPAARPVNPCFSSGPCAKRPGWTPQALDDAALFAAQAVRKAAGIEFTGTDPEFTGYSVEVVMADPEKLRPGRHSCHEGLEGGDPA